MDWPLMVVIILAAIDAAGVGLMVAAFVLITRQGGWNQAIQQRRGCRPIASFLATQPAPRNDRNEKVLETGLWITCMRTRAAKGLCCGFIIDGFRLRRIMFRTGSRNVM